MHPPDPGAHVMRGRALRQAGRHAEALACFEQAIAASPRSFDAHLDRAVTLGDLGREPEAIASYDAAIALRPDSIEAHYNRAAALHALGRQAEALEGYSRAIELRPGLAAAYNNRGVVQRDLGRHAEALEDYARALALDPQSAEAHNNRGVVLRELKRYAEALAAYERAIAIRPAFAQAHCNRGSALADLGRHREALESEERALALAPRFAEAWVRRGVALRDLGHHAESARSLRSALDIDPDLEWVHGLWLHARARVSDWDGIEAQIARLEERVARGERATLPLPLLALSGNATLHRKAAETWVGAKLALAQAPAPIPARRRPPRLRIGYFSGDFREHATSYLMAELLEIHDRSAVEVTAFSFGPDTGDAMRARVAAAVENFVDVRERTDAQIAKLAREREIDIAVDLSGFIEESRTGIFARRAAPIQASFLGYPGTMGAGFIDYLIADATVAPEEHQARYAESLVHLPDTYQPNDTRRRVSDRRFTRGDQGLPDDGFVYCCFNNSYKILPAVFDRWMRVLSSVEEGVLWLLADSDEAADNLRREAARRGVDPRRLVFARRLPLAEHLARYRLADLFLDTLPYNAHTTASDALGMGVPVVTQLGEAFAGRVAASLLRAAAMPELVAHTGEEYETLAIRLAREPGLAADTRRRLADRRRTAPLFDTARFARNLESAYDRMFARYEAGLSAAFIRVD